MPYNRLPFTIRKFAIVKVTRSVSVSSAMIWRVRAVKRRQMSGVHRFEQAASAHTAYSLSTAGYAAGMSDGAGEEVEWSFRL